MIIDSTNSTAWNIVLSVNAAEVEFKLDTGADVSMIPEEMLKTLKVDNLLPANSSLTGLVVSHSKFVEHLRPNYQYKEQCCNQTIYVVAGLRKALLGRPAIEALKLITRLDSVEKESYKAKYPELFSGLGSLQGEHKIFLQPNCVPFAIVALRRVPVPLMPKVKEELDSMEHMGVNLQSGALVSLWCQNKMVTLESALI